MPAMAGIVVLRRSPRLKISNADAWSRVVFNPHTAQWCFLSHNFFGTGAPHEHCWDVLRASTFTSSLSARMRRFWACCRRSGTRPADSIRLPAQEPLGHSQRYSVLNGGRERCEHAEASSPYTEP